MFLAAFLGSTLGNILQGNIFENYITEKLFLLNKQI